MVPVFPVIELLDRLSIAELKFQKTQANQAELDFYQQQTKHLDLSLVADQLMRLDHIHRSIWELEYLIKSGQEEKLSLEEIGRRALAIRDLNRIRIQLKNEMAQILGDAVREIKQDHLSQ